MPEITLGKTDEVPEGEARAFDANGVAVAVANVGGAFYAFDDTCTHRQCSLAEGEIEGTAVVCPCHGSEFDITSGAVVAPPAQDPVKTYKVTVVDGEIRIDID
jgi:nitrite reductase/ring-hydroxylating ferredoxin subunit